MMPIQQQPHGFPMVSVMPPSMMGLGYGSQIPQGALTIQGGVPMGPMQPTGMSFMGQSSFMGMHPAPPQYTADMQKQFVEEQQKRFEHQQKMLEEERKRRQFEEQKQKLRLLSSVKPKSEKSRDDALEAIKGNLDGFSRDAKMHPTPILHPKKNVGIGMFPTTDPIQPMLPSWIYNDSHIPEMYKSVLEASMSATGIDTAKLYPILMSSGLPREKLGQIWALANRTMPGKLTKEELYTVLAMIAIIQRGVPAVSTDILSQFASAPVPNLSGYSMTLPSAMNKLSTPASAASTTVSVGPPIMAVRRASASEGAATQHTFMHSSSVQHANLNQRVKPEEDEFQDFQDASKSGSIDVSFSDFQSDISIKPTNSQVGISAPALLLPTSGKAETVSTSADKYAVFKAINVDKTSENISKFADFGDKYHVFRELEKPSENKSFGDGFADIKSHGADDGFTDFKTADSISPLDPPARDTHFPSQIFSVQPKLQTQPSLNVADLDPFSSVTATATVNSFNLPTTSSVSFTVPPLSSSSSSSLCSSVPTSSIAIKTSTLPDDFGDFSLFGDSANVSIGGQTDFADFMAFNSSTSNQHTEDKHKAVKQEPNPLPGPQSSSINVSQTMQSASSTAHDKYDIFKQLSLDNSNLVYDEPKYAVPLSKNDDDFADFQSDKFTTAETGSEKSFMDKVASFKHTKEDSASVKSLDLPSIGGSSVGKEDSEDALSIQFDMKLADVGGDLKHVMSDSSLDLPSVSGLHPPAADTEDITFFAWGSLNDRNGSALNILENYDWPEKDVTNQNKKPPDFLHSSDNCSTLSSTLIFQKKETSFGSSENITMTTVSKITTFSSEGFPQEAILPGNTSTKKLTEDLNGEMFRTHMEDGYSGGLVHGADGSDVNSSCSTSGKTTDDFGEFQREKPKISKFDFLMATTQGKVKSSEEMIKSELATLDLCAQGSHKRSLSLGDKEITKSSPAPEQPFRDRSNTLSEKPVLPVIRDKYKDLTGEVEESERYAYEWQRCLESALQVIKKANDTLNGISSSSVCTEVIQSAQGMEYLLGVVEVYRVTKRVELGIKATAVCSEKLQMLLKEIDKVWNNLIGFMSLAALMPDESALDFSSCMLRPGIKNAQELACGVCLLNVDSRSKKEDSPAVEHPRKAFNSETDNFKLSYGGHQYHASCANFWINCVEPKPPGLFLPDLL
ncbi:synergin gamma [Pelodytes ibericus]